MTISKFRIKDLSPGDIFMQQDEYYIVHDGYSCKKEDDPMIVYEVSLTGENTMFDSDAVVIKINGKFTIE